MRFTSIILGALPFLSYALAQTCPDSCYSSNDRWSVKCDADCSDCPMCNFQPPGPGDHRSACPAFNVMANHGIINRNGQNLNLDDVSPLMEYYFGVQEETARLVHLSFGAAPFFNPVNFTLSQVSQFFKNPSYINQNFPDPVMGKSVFQAKFDRLKQRANADGKITNYDLLEHYIAIITQELCDNSFNVCPPPPPGLPPGAVPCHYEGLGTGPALNYAGDVIFMANFANPDDFLFKQLGFNNMRDPSFNPGITYLPTSNLDIEYLEAIFVHNTFPDHYIRRDCNDPDQCFGQAFGRILDPRLPGWTQEMRDTYDAMEEEPEFSFFVEYANKAIIEAIYGTHTEYHCREDYYMRETPSPTPSPTTASPTRSGKTSKKFGKASKASKSATTAGSGPMVEVAPDGAKLIKEDFFNVDWGNFQGGFHSF